MQELMDIKFWLAFFRGRWNDMNDEGASAVEYGLLVSLIALVIITIVATLGGKIKDAFTAISGKFVTTAV